MANTGSNTAVTNLVSNSGVVATDTTGVGTARAYGQQRHVNMVQIKQYLVMAYAVLSG